jgi:mRNA-degrading endonuclease toxin of MazEF toxin-antitoxin module
MSSLCFGRIVWLDLPDSEDSATRKDHPAVIITPTDEIQPDGEIRVVGVSTKKNLAPREVQVDLPYQRDGKGRTGLSQPCSAVCTWLHKIRPEQVRRAGGTVPGSHMRQINEIIRGLAEGASISAHEQPPTDPPAST